MTRFEKIIFIFILLLLVTNVFIILQDFVFPQSVGEAANTYWYKALHRIRNYDEDKLKELHLNASKISSIECISCHGLKAIQKRFDNLHSIHLPSTEFDFQCTDCHVRIEIGPIVSEEPKRKVNLERCANCHEEKKSVANVPLVPKDHTDDDWTDKLHGKVAIEQGKKTCFECHEHGLDFCESCHLLRPGSHKDDWKVTHKGQAADVPENCYYCHKVSYCKQCHIKHTGDWINIHKDTVQLRGLDDCLHCHVMNFCSDCHIK